ncbi:MAG: transporter [Acidobacteriota bacterium]
MSRLDYAPKLKEIKITDIKKGIGVFTPKPGKPVSFAALKETLKKAGYALDSANITITGTLGRDDQGWSIVAGPSGQRFPLDGKDVEQMLSGAAADTQVELTADWKTVGERNSAREVLTPRVLKKIANTPKTTTQNSSDEFSIREPSLFRIERASFGVFEPASSSSGLSKGITPQPLAPIRTTSPGLTVYKGGAITPRLYLIKQHLGNLDVSLQLLNISVSYTPSPRVQLEAEIPISFTSFDNGVNSDSGAGLGNITLWSKFRFFRKVKTYGDRQASARFGLELPTGKKDAPSASQVNASAFVRQQLTPISGGLSPHFDVSFSQAGGRFIFGGNIEGILRSEREGFRMGNEVRVNTDTEYALLPRDYTAPGKELFVIFETTFVQRGIGRVGRMEVPGSNSTEFYVAPGLQYAADPRFVVEGSVQLPVVRNTGPEVLRTSVNVLLGVKYLF